MEVQQTNQKAGRKTATKKETTTVAAATTTNVVENTPAVETTNEKKPRAKKNAAAVETVAQNIETASPIQTDETVQASPESNDEVMSDAQEVLSNMSVISEQFTQLYAKFKSIKEFNSEFSKQFKKTFSKIERSVNDFDGHFSDVLIKVQTAAEKSSGKKSKSKSKTDSPSSENKVHAVNTPKPAHAFVVKAMGLAEGTPVSRTDVQKFIGGMIKAHKDDDYKVVVNGETQKSLFYINKGELGAFFKNIQAEFDKNGATEHEKKMGYVGANGKLPEQISYKMLMGYYSKCFPPAATA